MADTNLTEIFSQDKFIK